MDTVFYLDDCMSLPTTTILFPANHSIYPPIIGADEFTWKSSICDCTGSDAAAAPSIQHIHVWLAVSRVVCTLHVLTDKPFDFYSKLPNHFSISSHGKAAATIFWIAVLILSRFSSPLRFLLDWCHKANYLFAGRYIPCLSMALHFPGVDASTSKQRAPALMA